MKYIAVLLAIMISVTGFLWHRENEAAIQRENAHHQEELKQTATDTKARMDAEILCRETDSLRFTLGEEAAREYDTCKTSPPTGNADKIRCEKLSAELRLIQQQRLK